MRLRDDTPEHGLPASSHSTAGLGLLAATALIIADNVGTGVLALPGQIANVGRLPGLCLLLVMIVPNVYAGLLLHRAADIVEAADVSGTTATAADDFPQHARRSLLRTSGRVRDYAALAAALNGPAGAVTMTTCFFYYLSVFLQMANYLVVLGQTLQAALVGAWPLCRPWAGVVSAAITFFLNQVPSMAALGRGPALLSVLGILAVAVLCITPPLADDFESTSLAANQTIPQRALSISASFGGITFAVSPTLVMLNTRHAMAHSERLPQALLLAIGSYVAAFVVLVLLAGADPPSFLFDLVPARTPKRRLTALLLFAHVAVSYAISSVALCTAAERFLARRGGGGGSAAVAAADLAGRWRARIQWAALTTTAMGAAWLVANAAPFFDGLVDLIGSICATSFFLPALLFRQATYAAKRELNRVENVVTVLLMLMAIIMTCSGLTGAIVGIVDEWSHFGQPFACHAA